MTIPKCAAFVGVPGAVAVGAVRRPPSTIDLRRNVRPVMQPSHAQAMSLRAGRVRHGRQARREGHARSRFA
jgi:hypothetical protein